MVVKMLAKDIGDFEMPRKKKLSDEERKRRQKLSKRRYKLKKKAEKSSFDAFGSPNFLEESMGQQEDLEKNLNEQLIFEKQNPIAQLFGAEWEARREKGKERKRSGKKKKEAD